MSYFKSYFESISIGLNVSKYCRFSKAINPEMFFEDIQLLIHNLKKSKGRMYLFGNGASSAFANHMALDFSKNGGVLSRSLSDSALLTALSNDYSYESAMVEYLKIEGIGPQDLVITISSSGNSANVVNVLNFCKENKITTIAFSGLKAENESTKLADYSIYPPMKTYGMVECIHQIILHLILDESMGIYEWDRNDYQNMNSDHFNI